MSKMRYNKRADIIKVGLVYEDQYESYRIAKRERLIIIHHNCLSIRIFHFNKLLFFVVNYLLLSFWRNLLHVLNSMLKFAVGMVGTSMEPAFSLTKVVII